MELTQEQIKMYELANDINFVSAVQDAEMEIIKSKGGGDINFSTISERLLLIKKLKEKGFEIKKI